MLVPSGILFSCLNFDDFLDQRANPVLIDSAALVKSNLLNEKEATLGLSKSVRLIRLPGEEEETIIFLRYKVPYLRKEGFPERRLKFAIN